MQAPAKAYPVELSEEDERLSRARGKVLVVDPDAEVLAFAAEALHSFRPGFEVATARTSEHADAWLESFHPDLLLLGDGIAGEGAEGLVGKLRGDPRTRHCKVIVVSEEDSAGGRFDPARVQAQEVLSKPLSLQALLGTVRRLR